MTDISALIQTIAIYAIPVIFAITLHEAAHGYAALYFGDKTAYLLGRVSLNPTRHIDPIGTIALPLLLFLATSGSFLFGYAKPVPVQFRNLRKPKTSMIWVALAGPASNFVQALMWGIVYICLVKMEVSERFLIDMCQGGILANVVMFVFNLFPLPPLDGGRILTGLLPAKLAMTFARIEPWGFYIVTALVLTHVISNLWMNPMMSLTYWILDTLLMPIRIILS